MAGDCLFCRIAAGEIPSTEAYSDDTYYAFRDINPCAPTHILVVPRKHIAKITDIEPGDAKLVGNLLVIANQIAQGEGIVEQGFRYVINCGEWGGQAVFHLHLHILGGRKLDWPPG